MHQLISKLHKVNFCQVCNKKAKGALTQAPTLIQDQRWANAKDFLEEARENTQRMEPSNIQQSVSNITSSILIVLRRQLK